MQRCALPGSANRWTERAPALQAVCPFGSRGPPRDGNHRGASMGIPGFRWSKLSCYEGAVMMAGQHRRIFVAALALASMFAAPLSALLCCRIGGGHAEHEHAEYGHSHQHTGGVASEWAEHAPAVAALPAEDCPVITLPAAILSHQAAPGDSLAAPFVLAASPASLEPSRQSSESPVLWARGPPRYGGPIYLRTCALLI